MASQGYVDLHATSYIDGMGDQILTGDQVVTSPNGGIVVSGPNFSGYSLTTSSSFANELYNRIYSASEGAINPLTNYIYPVRFSYGNGYSFSLFNGDSNLIVTDSTTFSYNNGIGNGYQPNIFFVLTTPPPNGYPASAENQAVWTAYG